jgi:hypothetical protein
MPKRPDEYDRLIERADEICAVLASKRYVAVLGQAVRVYSPALDPDAERGEEATGVPVTFFGPADRDPATLYVTLESADMVLAQVRSFKPLNLSGLLLPNGGKLQA